MEKGRTVIYIDAGGVTHEALVIAANALNPGLLSIVYVDVMAPDGDNLKKVFDIAHADTKKENNPNLPSYALNAWKEYYEEHAVIPPDHPNFDHPFKQPDLATNGQPIPIDRPITSAFEKAHQQFSDLSKEDTDELKALSGSGGLAAQPVTTTEDLQAAIEGITDKNVGGEIDVTLHGKTESAQQFVADEMKATQDGGDPPNCQPGQLC